MQSLIVSKGTAISRHEEIFKIIEELLGDTKETHDLMVIERAENKKAISIDQARELIKFINIKPVHSPVKVVYIREAQALSMVGQNALLKIIEEPPEYAKIILSVNHKDNLLPTIISRCVLSEVNVSDSTTDHGEKNISKEFVEILSSSLGARVDWVTRNKDALKDRDYTVNLLTTWECILRDIMMVSAGVMDSVTDKNLIEISKKADLKTWKLMVAMIQNVLLAVKVNNVSLILAVEKCLFSLPV